MTDSLRVQLGGITFGVLLFFTAATALYGLTGYNVYRDMLGFGSEEMKYLYGLFGLMSLERIYAVVVGEVDL